ncbi:hypothetical protein GCM10010095_31480 [Streptomyces anthocyanicus]|nr:hypothetical protein GCM10010095_31480 [Streptomyces anthocyanicus]
MSVNGEADEPGWEVDPDDEWGVAVLTTVGRQLKLRREAVGLRAGDFGVAVGYGEDLVYKAEGGKRIPRYTVPVVAADLDADEPWLVTAHAPGPSLQQAVGERGPLPADEVAFGRDGRRSPPAARTAGSDSGTSPRARCAPRSPIRTGRGSRSASST